MSKARVMNLAERLGASIDLTSMSAVARGYAFEVTVDPPEGHYWAATGTHQLVCRAEAPGESRSVWTALLQDMLIGVTECHVDCEAGGH